MTTSPQEPVVGEPFRVIVVAEVMSGANVRLSHSGKKVSAAETSDSGPPAWAVLPVTAAEVGEYTVAVEQAGCEPLSTASHTFSIKDTRVRSLAGYTPGVWPIRRAWSRDWENVYSAWIEVLFDAPSEQQLSWPALHEVLRDPKRNFLHNHLGLNEDEGGDKGLTIRPDCADLPYFLRAYFAFKYGLPFGYSLCSRGSGGQAPTCPGWDNVVSTKSPRRQTPLGTFGQFIKWTLADAVHSGSARTPLTDDENDYYPVPLSADALRPGTVYADPYGHVLVVAKRVGQTPDRAGLLFAVDGQPDGTVARKRFWRGNFLFAHDPALGGPGFKRFRPVVVDGPRMRRLSNREIASNADYADMSLEQADLTIDAFYDRMDDVLSPDPLDAERALLGSIDALEEQVKARVTSIENGRKFLKRGSKSADMPDGPEIFETTGAWEDFSTPSRDLRLLIAVDVVQGFPVRAERRRERYRLPEGVTAEGLREHLKTKLQEQLLSRKIRYLRSDDSEFELSLKDASERAPSFEMAYNPNDCPELRWGASKGTDEMATCKRHAPWKQRAKMSRYRAWFKERKRPPRK